ncbi:MAG: signal peptide peptidase SppA [Firmicutes bacterium]|nr:signal peptide peptidase SppA [Bacillota bacterium]
MDDNINDIEFVKAGDGDAAGINGTENHNQHSGTYVSSGINNTGGFGGGYYANAGMAAGGGYAPFAPQKKKKRGVKIAVTALIIVAILLFVFIAASIIIGIVSSNRSSVPNYGHGKNYVGILYIEGTMTSSSDRSSTYQQSWLINQIDYMMRDSSNNGIMLYVNSPGGEVYAADELYLQLEEYKERTGRPLYAYFVETAASGAYYASAGADKIAANRNCTTGSIGVYMGPVIDASVLMEKIGVSGEIIKSSENKAMGNYFEPMTEEQRAIYQSIIDETYEQFVGIVAEGRGMSMEQTKTLADGRVYTAKQALNKGLIDKVCGFEDFQMEMLQDNNLACEWVNVRYKPKQSWYDTLMGLQESVEKASEEAGKSDIQLAMEILEKESDYKLYALMR